MMQPGYAPIQYRDVPAPTSAGAAYRISYGVEYGGPADPHFVYRVERIEDGKAADGGFVLPEDDDYAVEVAKAILGFVSSPHPL